MVLRTTSLIQLALKLIAVADYEIHNLVADLWYRLAEPSTEYFNFVNDNPLFPL